MVLFLGKGRSFILNDFVEGSLFAEGINKIYNHTEVACDC